MKLRWPPKPLGLGTPLNLAVLSPETRAQLARSWWLAPVVGIAAALAVVAIDRVLFGGVTMRGTPDLSSHPSIGARVLVALIGSLFEELVFRVGVATVTGWLSYWILQQVMSNPVRVAQWVGVITAAAAIGFMHVGQGDDPTRLWRILSVNAVGNIAYGWIYWRRGLELAWATHVVVTCALFIGVPALR